MSDPHVAPSLLHRPSRGLSAALLGVAAVFLGGFGLILAIERLRTGTYPWGTGPDGWLGSVTWTSIAGWITAVVLVLLGLLLLIAAWTPGRRSGVLVDHDAARAAGSRQVVVPNEDLERWLRRAVTDLDGVAQARIRVSRRRITALVTTSVADPNDISDAVTTRLRTLVDALDLTPNPVLRIRMR